MAWKIFWLGVVGATGLASCVPVAIPPARIEAGYGPYSASHERRVASTGVVSPRSSSAEKPQAPLPQTGVLRASGGLHLASLMPAPSFPLDVGVGYVLNYFPGNDGRVLHGAYGEVAPVLLQRGNWRVLAGVRAELAIAERERQSEGYGLFGRASAEVFQPIHGTSAQGGRDIVGAAGYGMLAAGVYAEAGTQKLPGGDRTVLGVVGLSVRTPAAFFLICCAKK